MPLGAGGGLPQERLEAFKRKALALFQYFVREVVGPGDISHLFNFLAPVVALPFIQPQAVAQGFHPAHPLAVQDVGQRLVEQDLLVFIRDDADFRRDSSLVGKALQQFDP